MTHTRITLGILIAAGLAALMLPAGGCVKPDAPLRFTPAWETFEPQDDGWTKTQQILLISDCQFHNLLSDPLPERNLSAESMVGTAIRPPQLDLFATDVLEYILAKGAPEASLILHLGDALDLGCEGEFDTFLKVMATTDRPWLMAPGNHDTFYFGNYDPQDEQLWSEACHHSGSPLRKDRFIKLYVAAILQQSDPGFTALAAALDVAPKASASLGELAAQLPDSFEWQAEPGSPGVLTAICWSIDHQAPWRSFILQAARLSSDEALDYDNVALLLDSCQYERRPVLMPNAWMSYPLHLNCGMSGEMLPNQLRTLRRWIEELRRSDRTTGFTLACHHPFDALTPRAKSSLGFLWREKQVSLMVTAHTHQGYFAYHELGGEAGELELNIASTTDWPMEWRTLQGFLSLESEQAYIHSERHTLLATLRAEGDYFEPGWEVPIGSPDDYRKYKSGESAQGVMFDFYWAHHLVPYWLPQPRVRPNNSSRDTEAQVKDTLLWTYLRLLRYFPTDPTRKQPKWPPGCRDDRQVIDKILAIAGQEDQPDLKAELLAQLSSFERSRASKEVETGRANDDERARFKLSQAAWAARFESSDGRRLSVEDELIRLDWAKTARRMQHMDAEAKAAEARAAESGGAPAQGGADEKEQRQ